MEFNLLEVAVSLASFKGHTECLRRTTLPDNIWVCYLDGRDRSVLLGAVPVMVPRPNNIDATRSQAHSTSDNMFC